MLDLILREEFRGKRLKGTTVDFTNTSKTGALDVSASDFLKITYPSFDLLKTVEATAPGQSRPVVFLGASLAWANLMPPLANRPVPARRVAGGQGSGSTERDIVADRIGTPTPLKPIPTGGGMFLGGTSRRKLERDGGTSGKESRAGYRSVARL